ncbi:MAG: iron ABC transporter permease [Phycisphaerae bacterium]|nr:iron ABC transporter permease [Phycisphaerae bacterium]
MSQTPSESGPERDAGVSPARPAGILPASGGDDPSSSSGRANGANNAGETPASREAPVPQASLHDGLTSRTLLMYLLCLAGATVGVLLLCTLFGQASLWDSGVWPMRLRRMLTAAIVGAALSTSGMALQGLLRNPLAEPYILGVSSGAGVGVLMASFFTYVVGLTWLGTPACALAGAGITCAAVYFIAQRRGRLDPYTLLLSGVIVNAFNGALMLTLYLNVPPGEIVNFATWSMGYITGTVKWTTFTFALVALAGGWVALLLRGAHFNMLGLGDDVASSSGVRVQWLRIETFVLVSLMTAGAVAISGPIGFVGLIVPHICRLVVGPDHRRLALVCGFAGAMFVMIGQTLCSLVGSWLSVGELPVGILTALTGGPFFIYLLRKRRAKVEA